MGAENDNRGAGTGSPADASGNERSVEVVELDDASLEPAQDSLLIPPPAATQGHPAARAASAPPPPPPPRAPLTTTALGTAPPARAPGTAGDSIQPPRSAGRIGNTTGSGASTPSNRPPPITTMRGVPSPPSVPPGSRPAVPSIPGPPPASGRRSKPPPPLPGGGSVNTPVPGTPIPSVASTPGSVPNTTPTSTAAAPDVPREDVPWLAMHDRLGREAESLAGAMPARAALLLTAQGRAALDVRGDTAAAETSLARAATLAHDARFVALSRRWLAERRSRPGEVLSLARLELPLAGDPRERVALLWQIAAIEEHATGQIDAAERALREAAGLDPQDLGVWESLAALYVRRKQFREAVVAWETLAAGTEDPAVRGALQTAAASLREVYLDDAAGTKSALERALEADPTNVAAQAALEPIYLRARAWIDYARVVVRQGDQVGEPGAARECYERAGDVLWECASDGASAGACYERAAAMAPREVAPLEKFAAVLEGMGRYADLPRVYERMLQVLRDPIQQAAVLLRLGALNEARLDKPDEALKAYKRALDVAPTFVAAAQALAALYRGQSRWEDLAALELTEADRIALPAQRAARYVALAELHASALGKPDEAMELYERALALDPSNTGAFDALDAMYRARSRWDQLIALHEKALDHARDPRRVRAISLQLAALHLEHADASPTGDPTAAATRAAKLLRDTLGREQDAFPTLVALARALAAAGKWPEHVEVLEQQAKLLTDKDDLIATLYRVGAVVETRLGDPRRALAAYQRVLEHAPRHELALAAIARVYQSQNRWEDLIATERKLLELCGRPEDAASLLYRIGRIAEERLGRAGDAVRAYEEALLRLPTYTPAAIALERLLRAGGQYARLAEVFDRQAEVARDTATKARALCLAASVYELHLNDPKSAIAAYDKALAAQPGLDVALWGLSRLRESSREWAALESVLQTLLKKTSHSGARLRLLVRLARVHELRLNSNAKAAELYEEALATAPQAAAPLAIDRLRVARTEGRRELVAKWQQTVASASKDGRVALALLRLRALAAEYGGGSAQEAADAYAAAREHARDDRQVLEGLARNLARLEDGGPLPDAIRARAAGVADVPTRTLLLFVAGALNERAGRDDDAERAYDDALTATPDFLPALEGQRRLRAAAEDWAAVAQLSAQIGTASSNAHNAADARLEAGELYADRLGDKREALAQFRAVLTLAPSHARAFARASQLLEGAGDWGSYVTLVGGYVDAIGDAPTRARLLAARAAVLAEKVGDAPAAIADLRRALQMTPEEPALLGLIARLYEREQHWQDAAQAYERLAAAAREGPVRREALLAQARIWTQRVRDYDRARALLEDVLRADPSDRGAGLRLAEVVALSGDHARARDLYKDLSSTGSPADRARALLSMAEVQRTGMGDLPASHATAGHALLLAAGDASVVPVLEEHYARTEDWGAYATLGDEALAHAPAKSPGVLALHMSLARVYREKLGALDPADRHLRAAIEAFPSATEPRIALAYGLLGGNDHAAVAEFRRVIDLDPTAVQAYRGLLTVCQRMGLAGAAALLASTVALLGEGGPLVDGVLALAVTPNPVAGSLPADDALQLLVGTSRARNLRRVLALLDPHLHEIFPAAQQSLDAVPRLPDSYPAVLAARSVAAALCVPNIVIARASGRTATLLLSEPRALLLGPDHLAEGARPRVLFDAAYTLSRVAAHSGLPQALPAAEVTTLLDVVTDPVADGPGYRELRKRVGSVLPRRARKDIERVIEESGGELKRETGVWDEEERKRALRAAVVFCRDVRQVAQIIAPDAVAAGTLEERRKLLATNAVMAEALRFAASEACWAAHRRLFGQA